MSDKPDVTSTTNGSGNPSVPEGDTTAPEKTAADTGSDLDTLLNEFNKGTAQNETLRSFGKIIKALDNKLSPVVEGFHQEAQERANTQAEEAVKAAIANIKKEAGAPETYPDRIVSGYLYRHVDTDPAALTAWNNRLKDPNGWKAVQARVKDEVAEDLKTFPSVEKRVMSDEERAVASVRGLSTEQPASSPRNPILDFHLSDQEWAKVQAEATLAARRTG